MSDKNKISELSQRIRKTLIKERLILFLGGVLGTIASVILVWLFLTLIAVVVVLPVYAKIGLLVFAAVLSLYVFWRLAFSRLLSGTEESTALKLEKKYEQLKGRLIAALQFARRKRDPGYSADLINATIEQADRKAADLDFNKIISAYQVWRSFRAMGIIAVMAVLLLIVFPGLFSFSYQVYSNPTEVIAPPLGYDLANYPGSVTAIKYRDLDLGGVLTGDQFPYEAVVYYKFAGGIWQKRKVELNEWNRTPAALGDSLMFYTTLKQVRRSLDYYVKAGKITTAIEHVEVVDRPHVTGIKTSIFYPSYTGLQPAVIDENDGSVSAVIGSRVNMKIQTNVPVKLAEMIFDDSSRAEFKIDGLTAERSFRIDEDRRYYISLLDNQNEVNPDPIEYQITAVPDEYPIIDVVRPGMDINLNDEMMVPFLIRISDDYGFSSLVLKYQLISQQGEGEENIAVLHFSDRIKTEGEIDFNWDLDPIGMMPSEYVKYHFELADNDAVSGPKITRSRQYIARLPSLDEIIAQTEAEYGQNVDQAEEFLRQHRELSERMKNIARKMEQERGQNDQKLNWQNQKELEDVLNKDAEISEQLEETAAKMDELIDKMQENRLASRELLEKLAEIQKLFEEVATPEMKEARLKLMEALKQMDQKQLEEALKNYQMTQEDLMQRLDRTISLLKKMKIEQKVNAMTEMARELVKKQEKVNNQTGESNQKDLPDLVPQENQVKKGFEKLKEESEKLREILKEVPFLKSDAADQFCRAVDRNTAGENMQQMSKHLNQKEKEPALSEGQQSYSKLLQLLDEMQKQQSSMCQGGGGEAARMMRDAIEDINYVSGNQEELIDEVAAIRGQSEALRDLATGQMNLKEMLRSLTARIEDIGKESPFVAAELNNLMRNAGLNMDLSIDKLTDKRGRDALNYQKEAMFKLNRAAVRMLDALEKQNKCNKGGSCSKPSQKMQSLCNRQNSLNQQTQQCQNPGSIGENGPAAEAMRRLAAEQGAIRKSLQELQNEFGDSREVLGRLDAIADDMQKVADQLAEGEVGQETRDRQLKIYSRMLDATRTMQRKDFTEERQAQSGEDISRSSPPSLSGNQLRGNLNIEDRLRQFLNESYPPEYEEHIKAYFKALMEQLEY